MANKLISTLLIVFACSSCLGQFNVRFVITSLPSGIQDQSIFIVGSFNSWNPGDPKTEFLKGTTGTYSIRTKLERGVYEFKLTRGNWNKVECATNGTDIQNRMLDLVSDTTISIQVSQWKDNFKTIPRMSTASKNVHLVSADFEIPQLNRTRKVWIYLPPGYENSKGKYPVMYMQDGQNVFDEATSFSGEWGVDETLDSISNHSKEMIVVAVDHGGAKRINEYCPYDMEKYGKGEGNEYVDFLVKTLKPFIDKHYRTLKTRQHTFVAGSSMGGLISFYAVLKYPKTFGGAGVFSPALWVAPKIFDDIKTKGSSVHSKIYFYCGGQEGATMQPDMERAFAEMRNISDSKMECVVRPDGKHSEAVWKEEFPLLYLWMMEK